MQILKYPVEEVNAEGIFQIHLQSESMKVHLSNYGATICAIYLPDNAGKEVNVVLGYDTLQEYLDDKFYVGSTVGRVAGRISNSSFKIKNKIYELSQNDSKTTNHLHGGKEGLNRKIFNVSATSADHNKATVTFYYYSADLEEGYPGNLEVWVTYTLTSANCLQVQYKAITDKETHVNLTNHTYFNLTGNKHKALEQELQIAAGKILETTPSYIPTGKFINVLSTPYDFLNSHRIDLYKSQLLQPGYNECFVLDKTAENAAVLYDPVSGRKMTLTTSYPAILFYTGDYLNGKFNKCKGVCLEAQFFPDAPNQPEFKGSLLAPGEVYQHHIFYSFN